MARRKTKKTFYQLRIEPLFSNLRFYILVFSLLVSLAIMVGVRAIVPSGQLQTIRLEQIYAFVAVIYLYIAVIAAPLTKLFTSFPGREQYLHARRAIGVSTFYFAFLHVWLTFFDQLGGFKGLGFLNRTYLTAVVLGFTALCILFLMAITSTDWAVNKMTFPRWKQLHRFVYLAGVALLIHVTLLGTHFSDLSAAIPKTLIIALLVLLLLESIRINNYLQKRLPKFAYSNQLSLVVLNVIFVGLGFGVARLSPAGSGGSALNVHAEHIKLAQAAQNKTQTQSNIPGLSGDATKRYTVSFLHGAVTAGNEAELRFQIFDAATGSAAPPLLKIYDKTSHLVIVDSSLNYYSHIHPEIDNQTGDLVVRTTLPKDGSYRLYLNFQPLGAIEQQIGVSLTVGNATAEKANQPVDKQLTKPFGDYTVSLASNSYKASELSVGQQKVTFILHNKDGSPVTTLKPYLAAFGHLVMINEETYDYIHVHPTNIQPPAPDSNGGPSVEFMPLGLYGPIKPGTYRVFAQFNPNNQLLTADFTVEVK